MIDEKYRAVCKCEKIIQLTDCGYVCPGCASYPPLCTCPTPGEQMVISRA